MLEVLPCITPTPPVTTCKYSRWYGIPRGKSGRNGQTIQGIVLHCLDMDLPTYDSHTGAKGTVPALQNHTSVHYAISEDGIVHQYVKEEDIAWGSRLYMGNFPTTTASPYPGWPVLSAANPNEALDLYVVHVGIAVPKYDHKLDSCTDPCDIPHLGMSEVGYRQLVRLLAYLADAYNIPIDGQHIAFHEQIENTTSEGCACIENFCLLCDVDAYCEKCINPADSTYVLSDEIKYLYGENSNGCRVKVDLATLKQLLGV